MTGYFLGEGKLCCVALLGIALLCPNVLWADENVTDVKGGRETQVKELSGMSIVGNDEAPKSLYIVPWKGSELGSEVHLDLAFDHSLAPIDRDVLNRQLQFFNQCKNINNGRK